jgi:hypothetical protein
MSWWEAALIFVPGVITGVCSTLTVMRPWRPKVVIEAETDR